MLETIKLVINGGELALLALVLAGLFRLAMTLLPRGIEAMAELARALGSFGQQIDHLGARVDHLDQRLGEVLERQNAAGVAIGQVAEGVHAVRQQTDPNIQIPLPQRGSRPGPASVRAIR